MKAISQIPVSFLFQSNRSLLADGRSDVLTQPTNELIVPSTKRIAQMKGSVVGVAGFSQTPVAFKFQGAGESGVIFCRPGQKFYVGEFDAFEYGLPFGWLGGGLSVIFVGHTPDADLDLGPGRPEIIFHRLTVKIQASVNPLPALVRNWPLQFPWSQATRGDEKIDQKGNPIIRVEPTRALMRLSSSFLVDKAVGLIFRGSREFDEQTNGVVGVDDNNSVIAEVRFPATTDPVFPALSMAVIPEDFLRLACDEGGLTIVNLGDAALTDQEIEIVRFGRI